MPEIYLPMFKKQQIFSFIVNRYITTNKIF